MGGGRTRGRLFPAGEGSGDGNSIDVLGSSVAERAGETLAGRLDAHQAVSPPGKCDTMRRLVRHCSWLGLVIPTGVAIGQVPLHSIEGATASARIGTWLDALPDVDGDGRLDVIAAGPLELSLLSSASGNSLWTQTTSWTGGSSIAALAGVPDVDGDGRGDVLVAAPTSPTVLGQTGEVRVLSGATGALIRSHVGSGNQRFLGASIAGLRDIDGDGLGDYLIASRAIDAIGHVELRSGVDGHLVYSLATGASLEQFSSNVANIGDIDGDARDDFAVARESGAVTLHSGANGSVLRSIPYAEFGAKLVAGVGDVDADGVGDVVVQLAVARVFSGRSGSLLLEIAETGTEVRAAGDTDADGHADLVLGGFSGFATPYARVVSGADGSEVQLFRGHREPLQPPDAPLMRACSLGDLDGDGRADLALAQPSWGAGLDNLASGKVWLYQGSSPSPIGTAYAFGDGSGAPCPCGNVAPNVGGGCSNSRGVGATLRAFGSTSIASDAFALDVRGVPGFFTTCTLAWGMQAAGGLQGLVSGDGRRAIAGGVRRFQRSVVDLDGFYTSGIELAAFGPWSAGQTVYFQALYRDATGPCGSGFNLTNGVALTFTP